MNVYVKLCLIAKSLLNSELSQLMNDVGGPIVIY